MKRLSTLVSGTALALAAALTLSACGGGSSNNSAEVGVVIVTAAQPPSFSYETSATGYEAAEFFVNTGATLIRNPYVAGSDGLSAHQEPSSSSPCWPRAMRSARTARPTPCRRGAPRTNVRSPKTFQATESGPRGVISELSIVASGTGSAVIGLHSFRGRRGRPGSRVRGWPRRGSTRCARDARRAR